MDIKDYKLEPLWEVLIELYQIIAKLCDENHIRYYVGYGSVLGAVRHNGFIPWDDDLDVMIPRNDYDRFLKIATCALPKYLKIINWRNTPEFNGYLFSKIQDTRREKLDAIFSKCSRPIGHGIFIDIYPIDGYPESLIRVIGLKLKLLLLKTWTRFCVRRGIFLKHTNIYPKNVGWRLWMTYATGIILYPWYKKINNDRKLAAYCDHLIRKYPFDDSKKSSCWWRFTSQDVGTIWSPSVFGMGCDLPFGNTTVRVPSDYKRYLTERYGYYMKLPPPEQRKPGHVGDEPCPWAYGLLCLL